MSEEATAPQVDEVTAATPAETKTANPVPDAAPSEESGKGEDEAAKTAQEPTPEMKSDETAEPANSTQPSEKVEPSNDDKSEEMITDKIDAPTDKLADESADVKMETSITESKPAEDKAAEVTNASEQSTTQPPSQQAARQVNETKEPVVEVKPVPAANEQPQAQKQPDTALPTRQYLDATVVPILHSALSQLAKIRPEDPIQFLCTYLQEYKDTYAAESK